MESVRFEFAARAIAATEASALSSSKQEAYINKRWPELIPHCTASYEKFMKRQIAAGAKPLPGSL